MRPVIKLGGSLLAADALPACLRAVLALGEAPVVVTGGGGFADQVRQAQQRLGFADAAAHRMALLAMQQTALLCQALQPEFALAGSVAELRGLRLPAIWLPAVSELDAAGVPASWDVTSDSLAAWLAGQLDAAELIVVKSAAVPAVDAGPALWQDGIVDAAFRDYAAALRCPLRIVNSRDFIAAEF